MGCSCYWNDTCDPLPDGSSVTCAGGVCLALDAPPLGSLGARCTAGTECGLHEGERLACERGLCALPRCPFGELGCPCGPLQPCGEYYGHSLVCDQGTCQRGDCSPGEMACGCDAGICAEDTSCRDGLCRRDSVAHAVVSSAAARACDVVLVDAASEVVSVRFDAAIRGAYFRHTPRTGLSFIAREDAPFPDDGITIVTEGVPGDGAPAFSVEQVTCYDGRPELVEGVTIDLTAE